MMDGWGGCRLSEWMDGRMDRMTDIIRYCFQGMFDYLDNAVIKLCDMPTVGTDLGTVKQQIEELKVRTFHYVQKQNICENELNLYSYNYSDLTQT